MLASLFSNISRRFHIHVLQTPSLQAQHILDLLLEQNATCEPLQILRKQKRLFHRKTNCCSQPSCSGNHCIFLETQQSSVWATFNPRFHRYLNHIAKHPIKMIAVKHTTESQFVLTSCNSMLTRSPLLAPTSHGRIVATKAVAELFDLRTSPECFLFRSSDPFTFASFSTFFSRTISH